MSLELVKCRGCIQTINSNSQEQYCEACLPFKKEIENVLGNYPEAKSVSEVKKVAGTVSVILKDENGIGTVIAQQYYYEETEIILNFDLMLIKDQQLDIQNNGTGILSVQPMVQIVDAVKGIGILKTIVIEVGAK